MGHTEDLENLFRHCKTGNSAQLWAVIEKGVSLNVRDRSDATPLYYACLCGHLRIVQMLLYSGAICNADTFDAERCLHGALTIEIRNYLKQFQVAAKTVLMRSSYHKFLTTDKTYTDAAVTTQAKELITYHRCIVNRAIKGDVFKNMVQQRKEWAAEHVGALLDFVYTAVIDSTKIADLDGLETLSLIVEGSESSELSSLVNSELCERRKLFAQHNRRFSGKSVIEGDVEKCVERMVSLFSTLTEFHPTNYYDIRINVNNERTYFSHKCVVCLRSPYLQSYIDFADKNSADGRAGVISINSVKTELFHEMMRYIYTDDIRLSNAIDNFELLEAADMFLVARMKNKIAKLLCDEITVANVVEMVSMARYFSVEALENEAVQFISKHLEEVLFTEGFKQLVRDDVSAVIERQEVDSIDIIDALRFHLHTSSEGLNMVDKLLDSMNLIA